MSLFLFLLLISFLSACANEKGTATNLPNVQNGSEISTGYPAPALEVDESYPAQGTRQAYIPASDLSTDNVVMPTPEKGLASVAGILYSYTEGVIIPDTLFYMTPATGENKDSVPTFLSGPKKEEGDFSGWSDANGLFILNNVVPGNYYIVVWAPFDWIIGVKPDNTDTLLLLVLESDNQSNLGVVNFPWP